MYLLRYIHPLSTAKFMALLFGILGLIEGILFSIFSGFALSSLPLSNVSSIGIWVMGFVIFPVASIIIGFIGGLVFAAIYNLSVHLFGGVKVDFADATPPQTP